MEYLHPCIPELKIRDYEAYRAFHCGICSYMIEKYGFLAHMMLSNDAILFALLADGLAGREATKCQSRCPKHWLHGQEMMCHTLGIRMAAQLNALIVWHLLNDEQTPSLRERLRKGAQCLLLKKAFRKVSQENPAIERLFIQEKAHRQALELSGNKSFADCWEPEANVFGALFVYCAPDQSAVKALRRAGRALGKILYLMRCIERYHRDQVFGYYNIYLQNGLSYESAVENAKYQCGLAVTELANAYNLLDMKVNRTLVDNIVFEGLEESVGEMGKAHRRKRYAL